MIRLMAAALLSISSILPAAAQADRGAVRQACHDDFKALCSDVQRGSGRGRACLEAHLDKVSAACKAALEAK